MNVKGCTALVTGAASGLGAATMQMLVEQGASVAIADLPSSDGERLAAELGSSARFFALDVTKPEQVEATLTHVVEVFGQLDVTVNCAGIAARRRIVNRQRRPHPLSDFRRMIDVNLAGTWDVARWSAYHMAINPPRADDERGVIVNVASVAACAGGTGQSAYAASKAGVAGMTLPMARDLAHWGIRVVAIAPGAFETPILASTPPEQIEQVIGQALFPPRLGLPEEFARLVHTIVETPAFNAEVIPLHTALRTDE
jgi:3-hydroxyacyl-CoA dehydrogenase/3-hydroxy-2-methylbutyryl-CoA dehydrogenase